jgi:hypothetical protein
LRYGGDGTLSSTGPHELVLTIVKPITALAFTAELELDGTVLDGRVNVILKHARTPAECKLLLREHETYVRLACAGVAGIAKTLGLFEYANSQGLVTNRVFILLDAGTSLPEWKAAGKLLTASQR